MNHFELVDGLCEAIDAGHTGCEIVISDDGVRVIRTFSYACARDFLITDVLRAIAARDWRKALADAEAARRARIDAYEEKRRLEESRRGLRLRGAPTLTRPS